VSRTLDDARRAMWREEQAKRTAKRGLFGFKFGVGELFRRLSFVRA
jgi:hypothetical protein